MLISKNRLSSEWPVPDQREAAAWRKYGGVLPLQLPPFPSLSAISGTARSRQGRAVYARRRKIFCAFEKIFRSAPLPARTVLEDREEGKGGSGGLPGEDPGSVPRTLPLRVVGARHQGIGRSGAPPLGVSHQALRLSRKAANNFRFAPCISAAAWVSL
jgi:hypothetical protein